jgi:hypothetical protein
MPRYTCRFVDHGGNNYLTEDLDAEHDEAALDNARRLNVPSIGAGFDLWHGERQVHCHRNRPQRS